MKTLANVATSLSSCLATLILAGCAAVGPTQNGASPALRGSVHGGQQPVSSAAIQLYTVGTTGDGSAATPLLTTAVLTDGGGNFTITGDYTCPSAASLIYMVASGGNPGLSAGSANIHFDQRSDNSRSCLRPRALYDFQLRNRIFDERCGQPGKRLHTGL
jgi:hypothetical protein